MPFAAPIVRMVALLAGIHGTVRSAGEAAVVAGIHVEIDGTERTITDSAGRYAVAGLATGTHQVRFVSSRYEIRLLTVLLTDASDLSVDVELVPRPVFLPPISVVARSSDDSSGADPTTATEWHEAGHFRFAPGWQANQPAGGVDIQDALSRVPGVATRSENTTALSIHGGRGSDNLMLLDGIPVFGAVHFAGASSAVNPDAIAAMDVHTGVSSARFGGALSGVIELETGEAQSGGQLNGDISTADVRSTVHTSLGAGGGILLSARSSYRDLMSDGAGIDSTNGYQDFLAVDRTAIGGGMLRVVGFASTNRLRWDATASDMNNVVDPAAPGTPAARSDIANWQSSTIGATWSKPLGSGAEWDAAGWWSSNGTAITTLGADRNDQLSSGISEFGLSADWSQRVRASTLLFGGELTRPRTWYTTVTSFTQAAVNLTGTNLAAAPVLGAAYAEWDWHGASSVDFRVGVRGNTDFQQSISLDPRIVVNVHPDAGTRLEIGFGRTHQVTQSMLNEDNVMTGVIGPALLTNGTDGRPAASADQWVFSVARRLAIGVTVSLDGYLRSWQNVLAPAVTTAGFFVTSVPAYGDGAARGVNASISIIHGRLTAQASAGLAASVQQADGASYPSSFDQPWNVSGDIQYRLPARTTLQVRWNAGAGQPATAIISGIEWQAYQPSTGMGEIEGTAINLRGQINALRLAGPLRLDLGARREWHLGASERASGITTAVRLENVFDRADPIGIIARPDGVLQLLRGTPRGLVFEVGWAH